MLNEARKQEKADRKKEKEQLDREAEKVK